MVDSSVAVGGGPTGSSSSSGAGWKFPSSLGELVTVTDTCPDALSASEPVAGYTKHAVLHHNPISIEGSMHAKNKIDFTYELCDNNIILLLHNKVVLNQRCPLQNVRLNIIF